MKTAFSSGTTGEVIFIVQLLKIFSFQTLVLFAFSQNIQAGRIGDCGDGTTDYGCGAQETYVNCADIAIRV